MLSVSVNVFRVLICSVHVQASRAMAVSEPQHYVSCVQKPRLCSENLCCRLQNAE